MIAYQLKKPYKLERVDKVVPVPQSGEVLLKVHAIGLCGSDLNSYRGKNPLISYPRILGHELGCEVVKVGNKNSPYKPGDRVAVEPLFPCSKCYACRIGRYNCCVSTQVLGVHKDGGLSEFILLPEEKLHRENTLSFVELALVEPMAVSCHAVRRGEVKSGEPVLVLGCGPIGIGCIKFAKLKGAKVFAVDMVKQKLKLANSSGADVTIDTSKEDLEERIDELTNGEGVPVIIEATGNLELIKKTLNLVSHAGRIVLVGYGKGEVSFIQKMFLTKEVDLRGSRNSRFLFPEVIDKVKTEEMDAKPLVTQTYSFARLKEAFGFWDKNPDKVTKIIITKE